MPAMTFSRIDDSIQSHSTATLIRTDAAASAHTGQQAPTEPNSSSRPIERTLHFDLWMHTSNICWKKFESHLTVWPRAHWKKRETFDKKDLRHIQIRIRTDLQGPQITSPTAEDPQLQQMQQPTKPTGKPARSPSSRRIGVFFHATLWIASRRVHWISQFCVTIEKPFKTWHLNLVPPQH